MSVYVRNTWYVAGWSSEVEHSSPVGTMILNEPIVIYRTADGRIVALEDRCVHRLAPLSLGRCEGANLRCMYHGMLFDPSGRALEIPGQDIVPPNARVRSFPVVDRHSWIWVWMGDPDKADEKLIPEAVGPGHPDWLMGTGSLDYNAEARLIHDNLTDFSHLTFVHANSFQVGGEWADMTPKITPLERGVRFDRWIPNGEGPVQTRTGERSDGWISYDYLVPGILLMYSGSFPLGTAERFNFGKPDYDLAIAGVNFTSQAIVPITDKTSRYYFTAGPHKNFGDEALRDIIVSVTNAAFAEDKRMIEGQQRIIDLSPGHRIMPTVHDKGVTLFNRLIEKLAREEGGAVQALENVTA
jgi:vanillate O-demethylase monooxygenase subunit